MSFKIFRMRIIFIIFLVAFCFASCPVAHAYVASKTVGQKKAATDQQINTKEADKKIKDAAANMRSDFWVGSQGTVIKVLKDDQDGARHQRFILRLSNNHSILIAHNIDIAQRVKNIRVGDIIAFYGEYEWNNKGGVVHWTHHDPSRRKAGGWLSYQGKRYE